MRPTLARYAVLLLLASVSGAHAAALIGDAKAVLPAAESQGESGKITLKLGSSLFQDDVVRTASDGKVGLEFLDNTTLEIGSIPTGLRPKSQWAWRRGFSGSSQGESRKQTRTLW